MGLWLLGIGCSTGSLRDVQVARSTVVPTTHEFTWRTPESGTSWIEATTDGEPPRRTAASAPGTAHDVRLVGLLPGRTYEWRAFTETGGRTLRGPLRTLSTPPAPPDLPEVTLSVDADSLVGDGGYLLTSIVELDERTGGGWVVILDHRGRAVWWFDTGHVGNVPADVAGRVPPGWSGRSVPLTNQLDPDTDILSFAAYDQDQRMLVGVARHVPVGAMTDDEVVLTRLPDGHHDIALSDDGATVGYLAYQIDTVDGARWAADAVLEIPTGTPDQRDIDRIWSWHDDGPAEPSLTNPLQSTFSYDTQAAEWTHSNSLLQSHGAYFVMSKFLDCLVKIDRQSGRTDWILGGPFSDFTLPDGGAVWNGLEDSMLWSQAHMSDLTYDPVTGTGRFAVFDNGKFRSTEVGGSTEWSRLVEYSFDETARTVQEEWQLAPDTGAFTTLLGDVERIADDRWIGSWSRIQGRGLEEVDAEGETRWRVQLPDASTLFGRVQYLPSLDGP